MEMSAVAYSVNRITEVTPGSSALTDYQQIRGVFVNVAGNLEIVDHADNTVVLTVVAGIWHPMRPKKILSSSTTATGIFVGY